MSQHSPFLFAVGCFFRKLKVLLLVFTSRKDSIYGIRQVAQCSRYRKPACKTACKTGSGIGESPYILSANCWSEIKRALQHDFDNEKEFSYKNLDHSEMIRHFAKFISGIWQIHPFREGNTRTTAVFAIKYLRAMGFTVSNDLFAEHSWYFRNALVRANYRNYARSIEPDFAPLEKFFRNLLLGETNELKNRYLVIAAPEEFTPQADPTSTRQVAPK